jgi:hypothetical protein
MEQRNGRIDCKLQQNTEVFCHYFVYRQRPEDRILAALVRKTDVIKRELGSLSQVIDTRLAATLKLGIRRDSIERQEQDRHSRPRSGRPSDGRNRAGGCPPAANEAGE